MDHPTERIAHTAAIVTPIMEHWLEPKKLLSGFTMRDRSDNKLHHEWMLYCGAKSSFCNKEGRKEIFYLTTHSTHFIYGYMASDIW